MKTLFYYIDRFEVLFTFCKARWVRQKKQKENHATKVTKIPKTKRQKYGTNKPLMGKVGGH